MSCALTRSGLLGLEAMRRLDARACAAGPGAARGLLERVVKAALAWLDELGVGGPGQRVLVLAGPGNNGADGLGLARELHRRGARVDLYRLPGRSGGQGGLQAGIEAELAGLGLPILPWPEGGPPPGSGWDLAVDCLAGCGTRGPLAGPVAAALDWLVRQALPLVLAIDLPSGFHEAWRPGDPLARASHTLCVGFGKLGLYRPLVRPHAGLIRILSLGLAAEATDFGAELLLDEAPYAACPEHGPDIHKYQRGACLIAGGSSAYPGALRLAAAAALHSRAGLVHALCEPGLASAALPAEAIPLAWAGDPAATPLPARLKALVAGPGWDASPQRAERLCFLFDQARARGIALALDAGALDALAALGPREHTGLVLTPHAGELARLAGVELAALLADPEPVLQAVAARYRAAVLLKGAVSWIACPGARLVVYDAGNPLLAQAGSGDVLAGVLGAILAGGAAAGVDPAERCRLALVDAVRVLGRAGRLVAREQGWAPSGAVLAALPRVWAAIRPVAWRSTELVEAEA